MKYKISHSIEYLSINLADETELFSFFTTRSKGVSTGEYSSLNLGNTSDDDPDHVYQNREKLCNMMSIDIGNLIIPRQTHSSNVFIVDQSFLSLSKEERLQQLSDTDALITNVPEVCIGVTTADCVPVLIYDPIKRVVAAIHAGWKGTVGHIAAKTIEKMQQEFGCDPSLIVAAIGPSISVEKFEVGDEVAEIFESEGYDMNTISYRNPSTDKAHIDLWKANSIQLVEAGINTKNIKIAGICTYSNPDRFFSARRQTIHSGRMLGGGFIRKK